MATTSNQIGDDCGILIPSQTLKDLGWGVGSVVKVARAADGEGLVLTSATEADIAEIHAAKDLGWGVGSVVKVARAADGEGLVLTPASEAVTDVNAARATRVQEVGRRITDRHESVLKKLAQ